MSHDKLVRQSQLIFALLCFAYLFVPFHRVSPAVMAVDIMHDLHLDAPAIGILSSIFFTVYGAMQLPSGLLADSLGPRRTLPLFFALAAGGSILFGSADSALGLICARAIMGFGLSVVFICGLKLISRWFPLQNFARISGIYLGMGGLGLILGSGPMALLCSLTGWRFGNILIGLAGLLLAIGLWVWIRDTPEEMGISSPVGYTTASQSTARELWESIKTICRNKNFWFIAIWFFCHFSIHMSFGGLWGGPFLMDVHGASRDQAGSILLMMGLGMLAGGPLAGWLSDSVFKARRPVMLLNTAILTGLFIILAIWGAQLPIWFFFLWFFCLAVCGMGTLSVGLASVRDMFGDKGTGTGSGLLNTFPSFGVSLFQPLTGWVLEHQGRTPSGGFSASAYSLACVLYIGVALIGFASAWIAKEPMQHT